MLATDVQASVVHASHTPTTSFLMASRICSSNSISLSVIARRLGTLTLQDKVILSDEHVLDGRLPVTGIRSNDIFANSQWLYIYTTQYVPGAIAVLSNQLQRWCKVLTIIMS
jgi:hypothetical protein